jgi:hypothetical protein
MVMGVTGTILPRNFLGVWETIKRTITKSLRCCCKTASLVRLWQVGDVGRHQYMYYHVGIDSGMEKNQLTFVYDILNMHAI